MRTAAIFSFSSATKRSCTLSCTYTRSIAVQSWPQCVVFDATSAAAARSRSASPMIAGVLPPSSSDGFAMFALQ